jgi:hypothetical protein
MDTNPYQAPRAAASGDAISEDDSAPWAFAIFFYGIAFLVWIAVITATRS